MPVRGMLDELLRVRAVEPLDDGRIRLLARSYVPADGEIEKLGILGTDVADLIATLDWNLRAAPGEPIISAKCNTTICPRRSCRNSTLDA